MKDNLAETAGITSMMIANEHAKIAFNSIAAFHDTWITRKEFEAITDDQKACISEIITQVRKINTGTRSEPEIVEVEYVKLKLYDKQKALDSLTNLLGFNAPTKTDITSGGKTIRITLPIPEDEQ